jgi:uncharacterized OsmC-like protein
MSNLVQYKRVSDDEHLINFGNQTLPDIHIDYKGIPKEERGGTSVKLLGASCLYCFAATLGSALTARGAEVRSISGSVEMLKGKDEIRRTKVTEMNISVEVEIDDQYEPILEKCRKIMERGCLLTYTLEEAIEITYQINRKS